MKEHPINKSLIHFAYKIGIFLILLISKTQLIAQEDSTKNLDAKSSHFYKGRTVIKTNFTGFLVGNYPIIFEYFITDFLSIEAGTGVTGRNFYLQNAWSDILKDDIIVSGKRTYEPGFSFQFGAKYFLPKIGVDLFLHYNHLNYNMEYPLSGNIPGLYGTQEEYYRLRVLSFMLGTQLPAARRLQFEIFSGVSYLWQQAGIFEEQSVFSSDGQLERRSGTYPIQKEGFGFNLQLRLGYVIQ